jgi:dolichol-phosphate mannosyltransferase
VVVPCFNEEEVLLRTHARVATVLRGLDGVDAEVIYVDDGSRDATASILHRLHAEDRRVRVIRLSRNFGHQTAVSAGLHHASGDVVCVLDADLQDPPELLPAMLARWREGYAVVYGVRARRKESLARRVAYAAFYRLLRRIGSIDIPLDSGDFCLMDRRAVDALNGLPERNRFMRGLRAWVGFPQIGVPYDRPARAAGRTKYSLVKMLRLALDGLFSFSFRPLTLISMVGVGTSLLAFAGLVFFLVHRMAGFKIFGRSPQDVPGFTSIILSVLFIGGIQLMALGIIGEYLGRVFDEVKARPAYIVEGRLGFDREPEVRHRHASA